MDIGKRLKDSRIKCNLSQEYVAEKLRVSRQTISNWENNRSYPDILNVIELSNLYSISLDELIKEDKNMVEHLDESTNIVKSHYRLSKLVLTGVYLIIWVLCILTFWLFTSDGEEIGYSLMVFYLVLPVSTFIISIIIGKDNNWNKTKYVVPIIFGIMYMLVEYATYSLANMTTFSDFNLPDFSMIIVGAFISYIGLFIGIINSKLKKQKI